MTERLICIVEDDEILCAALLELLAASGYRAEAFSSVDAFLASPSRDQCHGVITDLALRGASGLQLKAALLEAGEATPVIVITGRPEEGWRLRIEAAGARLLPKPFEAQTLLDLLDEALRR
jgi:FixJ family two-component response regulator